MRSLATRGLQGHSYTTDFGNIFIIKIIIMILHHYNIHIVLYNYLFYIIFLFYYLFVVNCKSIDIWKTIPIINKSGSRRFDRSVLQLFIIYFKYTTQSRSFQIYTFVHIIRRLIIFFSRYSSLAKRSVRRTKKPPFIILPYITADI